MKKVLIIIASVVVLVIASVLLWYNLSLTKVSNDSEIVSFTVEVGTSTKDIVNNLYDAGLIKSKFASLIYIKLHNSKLLASTYNLSKSMNTKEIIRELNMGNAKANTYHITFVEGMRFPEYLQQIADNYNWEVADLVKKSSDKDFLKELIDKFWFVDDSILNDDLYYPLEGYIFPDTYEFYKTATFEEIITKMIEETGIKIADYKEKIETSNYSFHELLTMASIIEKEAVKKDDRYQVAQVIYKRLDLNMNLGMDVTTYYGMKKSLKEALTQQDLDNVNPYNTRLSTKKDLPVGPICSPSIMSIDAAINPADTDYIYFYANIKTGEVKFTSSYEEFLTFKENEGV